MKKYIYSLTIASALFSALSFNNTYAQAVNINPCGTTEKLNEYIKLHPEFVKKMEENEKVTQEYIREHKNQFNKTSTAQQHYIIPIVFHIIHQYGTENISDAQVRDAVRVLNNDYNKLNPDTINIVSPFDTIIANVGIEFRLAQKDPNGYCTNGIERIYSTRTNYADNFSKLHQWDRSKYLNVWVVSFIGSSGTVAGYSQYPAATTEENYIVDGVIIFSTHIGAIVGTGTPPNSRSLTHEIGHWLNLSHPWGDNNSPGIECGDDYVLDTPETKGSNLVCNVNLSDCNPPIIENAQNYMDYSYCSSRNYTNGQKERMLAALNSPVASRNNLWTAANLAATGTDVLTTQTCTPVADFYPTTDRHFICQDGTVSFKDASWNADVTGRSWIFDGGTPATSTAVNPSIVYHTPYWHAVWLTASNSVGSYTTIKENYVFVSPPWTDYSGSYSEDFEDATKINDQWLIVNKDNNNSKFKLTSSGSYGGTKALMLNGFNPPVYSHVSFPAALIDAGVGKGDVDEAITPSMDLSHTTSTILNFKYSYATSSGFSGDITEGLQVYYSLNCGQSWTSLLLKQGASFVTAGVSSSAFVPTMPSQWKSETITLPSTATWTKARFKFTYTSGLASNNLYIDNVNVSGVLGVDESLMLNNIDMSVYPNPTVESAEIFYNLLERQNIKIEVYDILGNMVAELLNEKQNEGEHRIMLQKNHLRSGIYNIKLTGETGITIARKLVIAE